ncbi:hypothetical protein WM42_1985 [Corynebacterium simulans]|uniref:hypothetical protein n=1 Tax=Corynebacterium simulans TaxID=146827 RepID=UPI000673CE10|nr:hypothetical protein [Corynebacterium simulans]AMO89687.1 hypothetical protein WM42_1985 [Corynebacterium simulans]CQD08862.1 conserved exported hypothetical protein [Corynebacterium striatum]
MSLASLLSSALVALITTAGMVYGQKVSARSQKETKQIEQSGPDWKAFTEEMRADLNKQDEKISSLESQVETLRERIDYIKSRYWLAVSHIRQLHLHYPDSRETVPAPEEIAHDI